ncbi:MAG: peptide deformylase [Pseudomonadota bacterium]
MALRTVLEYPDPRLRAISKPVDRFDAALADTVTDLIDTMHASNSIGLCAPQIDVLKRVLVMDHTEDHSDPQVFINPIVDARRNLGLIEERCLSVPDVSAFVLRATEIDLRACDLEGREFECTLSGMPAVTLQHEMDHFEGKLVADRVNWFKRRRLRAAERRAASV